MILSGKLSAAQRASGQRNYLYFNIFNASSYVCIGDNILILFALASGMPPYFVVIITAFFYLGNLGMLTGKYAVSKRGAVFNVFRSWVVRNISALAIAGSPFLGGTAGMVMLTLGAAGFYFFRSMGCTSLQPLVGDITKPHERSKFIGNMFLSFNIVALAALAVLIYIMGNGNKDLETFQGIVFVGAIFGIIASFFMRRIDESPAPRESATMPLLAILQSSLKNPRFRKLLYANSIAFCCLAMIVPVSMIALKQSYLISDEKALFFVLVQYCGGIIFSYVGSQIMGHTGPRPLLLLSLFSLVAVCFMWLFAPVEYIFFYILWIFLINGGAVMSIPMTLQNYFLNATDEKERVGGSMLLALFAGICAGIAGAALGSALVKTLPEFIGGEILQAYRVYFLIMLGVLVVATLCAYRLEKLADWQLSRVLGLFTTPRDLLSIYFINRMQMSKSAEKEQQHIDRLGNYHSELSEEALLESLESPKYGTRRKALLALGEISFSEKTEKALIEELGYGEFSTAAIAANLLGEHACENAVPALINTLKSSDFFLRGESMLALVKLQRLESYDKIIGLFLQAKNPRVAIMGAIALHKMRSPQATAALFKKLNNPQLQLNVRNEILVCLAEEADIGMNFYRFIRAWNSKANENEQVAMVIDYLESIIRPLPEQLRALVSKICSKTIVAGKTKNILSELMSSCPNNICRQAETFIRNNDALDQLTCLLILGFAAKHQTR